MSESKNKSLLYLNIIQLIIIVVLGYMLFNSNQQKVILNEKLSSNTEELSHIKDDLLGTKASLEKIKSEREALGLSVDSLNTQIAELDKAMLKLEQRNSISSAEIRKLNAKVSSLNTLIASQKEEIDKLNEDNEKLSRNVNIMQQENLALNKSVDEISTQNNYLQRDLKLASVLNVQNIEVVGLKDNNSEIKSQPFRKNQLSRFKVTFTIGENKAAEHNSKKFLMRMITPSGECFSDKRNGGGTFKDHNGDELKYTLSKSLMFENSNQWLSMVMPKGFNYAPGNYIIQIYCEGYNIGQSSFIVK